MVIHLKNILITLLALAVILATVYVRAQSIELEVVATMDEAPGNIAVTPDGLVVMSMFGGYDPEYKVMAIQDGELVPYPSREWALTPEAGSDVGVNSVLGLRSDPNGVVWLLDHGSRGRRTAQLVGWDTRKDQLAKRIIFEPPFTGFLNDLAVDAKRGKIFIVVASAPQHFIVVDIATSAMRKVLEGHPSVLAGDVDVLIDGRVVGNENDDGDIVPRRGGLNPITIDASGEWLYYGVMSGTTVWRVPVAALLDEELSPEELGNKVEHYADKSLSAGFTMDDAGNVYVTDVGAKGIGAASADGSYKLLFSDPRIQWPDGMAVGPDGYIYFTTNQQYRSTDSHSYTGGVQAPFYVFRFPAIGPSSPGR